MLQQNHSFRDIIVFILYYIFIIIIIKIAKRRTGTHPWSPLKSLDVLQRRRFSFVDVPSQCRRFLQLSRYCPWRGRRPAFIGERWTPGDILPASLPNSTPSANYTLGKQRWSADNNLQHLRNSSLRGVSVSAKRKADDRQAAASSRGRDRANDHGPWIVSRTLTSGVSLRLIRDKISSAFTRGGAPGEPSAFPKMIIFMKKESERLKSTKEGFMTI